MPSVTYSGTFGGVNGYDGATATLTGSALPPGAKITSVMFTLEITSNKYNSSRQWALDEIAVGSSGATPSATSLSANMVSTNFTFGGSMDYAATDIDDFTGNTIVVFAKAYTTHPDATSYLWNASVTVSYERHIQFDGFTDDPLVAGETPIKALHMQELQNNVATLRAFYELSEYPFSAITAGETSLAGWTAHVLELREAIDEMGFTHDSWIAITENKPRADVVKQLRDIVLAI